MGDVYRATDDVLGRTVAVKVLAERYARDPDARARFQREALAAARLSGTRNVVTIFDVGEQGERPLIVMEYLEGGTVHDRIRAGRVDREQALEWLEQTASALDRAHAQGVVHRDVKPANLLLDGEGNVHVSDFGIASTTGLATLTLPGTVLGTAGYLAPEQARGEPATPATDRYALGVVAFELLTGRRPFEADTATTEAFAHLHAPVPSATGFDPELPPAVDAVLAGALAKEPEERPASCAALVADLRSALAADDEAVAPTRVQPPAPAPLEHAAPVRATRAGRRRRGLAPFAIAAVGILAAGAAVASLLGSSGETREPGRRPAAAPSTRTTTTSTTSTTTSEPAPAVDGAELNDQGFALMQAGDFVEALPLLERAVEALSGTGQLAEAYASYNLAFTRFALDRCDGVPELLDRSEAVQGQRKEIDQLRREWEKACGGDEEGPGKSQGKGKGEGKDDD